MANLKNTSIETICTVYKDMKISGNTIYSAKPNFDFYNSVPTTVDAFDNCSNLIINKDYSNNIALEFKINAGNQEGYGLIFDNIKNSRTNGGIICAINTKTKALFSETNPALVASIQGKWFSSSGESGFMFKTLINSTGIVQDQAVFKPSLIQMQNMSFLNLYLSTYTDTTSTRFRSHSQVKVFDSTRPVVTGLRKGNLSLRQKTHDSNAGVHLVLPHYDNNTINNVTILNDGSSLSYVGNTSGRSINSGYTSWNFRSRNVTYNAVGRDAGALLFSYKLNSSSYSTKGYINPDVGNTSSGPDNLNFTGQHRNKPVGSLQDFSDKNGLIVVSEGLYSNLQNQTININEALPIVNLSTIREQNNVFGVISDKEDSGETREFRIGMLTACYQKNDDRLIINSIGEGCVWVTNVNGNLENGDYITTCEIPGYGMKQDSDILSPYTVAKITCDCDFDLNSEIYICEEFEWQNQTYRRAFVGCTYHCG